MDNMGLDEENETRAPSPNPGSIIDLSKGDAEMKDSMEIIENSDKANDKLVDLVSLLTNKINKNVKEIQVDIIDHYETNNKKIGDLETKASERVKDLSLKVVIFI